MSTPRTYAPSARLARACILLVEELLTAPTVRFDPSTDGAEVARALRRGLEQAVDVGLLQEGPTRNGKARLARAWQEGYHQSAVDHVAEQELGVRGPTQNPYE